MATTYALHVKLDLVLNDQPQRTYRDGHAIWDFEPEERLIWIDPAGEDHICEVPPVVLPLGYRPIAICGRPVTTTRLHLVESEDRPTPSCPACFDANLRRLHAFSVPPPQAIAARFRFSGLSLSVPIFVALLLLAPSLDGLAPAQSLLPDVQEVARAPIADDTDPQPDSAN